MADIKRGRLSQEERGKIESLALRNLRASQIAARLNRHPATVNFAMHSMGMKAPKDRRPISYTRRNGTQVHSFTPDEDVLIEDMRAAGAVCREVAETCLARFGRKRSPATIITRLRMLANRDDAQ
ncbi:helix-turn-helix domain-containing protein [Rhodoblastus sp. 17X3]|uniref:helix-turn-helix domain-containing protein n=1 Tax=Rhodoblastus sp. 17X3 TaxID=3047026 RepID=UPI0024B6B947|nr:helix-turn-helix domain-containing protein [Rhodoblastus sp. 17X3]MDI9847330.1 helix-turn-helix domain-containing protein [Rhodoblastus sp. 17X3]